MKKQVDQWLSFAEKGFKAILENKNARIPKVHNLEILFERTKPIISITLDLEMLQKINEVYIDSRYPGDIGLTPIGVPSSEPISSFIRFTEKLLTDLRKASDE